MSRFHAAQWVPRLVLFLAVAVLSSTLMAADRPKGVNNRIDPEDETVELFAGIERGQLEARLFVKDSTECRVMVKNLTDRPLNVQLPDAFAGVPVLAQMFDPALLNNNRDNNFNAPQRVGVGAPENNWLNNNNNFFNLPNNPGVNNRRQNAMPGPMFSIAPEKVGQFRMACVCLDHGKPDPKPRMPYQIKPIESVAAKPEVREVCVMLGHGKISQRVAQAAAWHFNNGLTWKQLEAEQKRLAMGLIREPFFTARELADAKKAAERASELVEQRQEVSAPDSLSRN